MKVQLLKLPELEVVKELEVPDDADLLEIRNQYDVIYGPLEVRIVEEQEE